MPTVTVTTAAAEWRHHLAARNMSPATVKASLSTLNTYVDAVGDTPVHRITGRHIDDWFAHYPSWAPRTRNQRLQIMRGFLRWCASRRYMKPDADPTTGWGRVRPDTDSMLRIPPEQFPHLLAAAPDPYSRAMVAVLLYTLCRASEIATLRVADVHLDEARIDVVRHKTHDRDTIPVVADLDRELRRYLAWYTSRTPITPGAWLFPARTQPKHNPHTGRLDWADAAVDPHKPNSSRNVTLQIGRVLRTAGFEEKHLGAHTLRRSGAAALYHLLVNRGVPDALEIVSSLLGHKSVQTTEIYLGVNFARRRRDDALAGVALWDAGDTEVPALHKVG